MSALEPRGSIYQSNSASLADILERVLDKGIVIAGDVQVNLLDARRVRRYPRNQSDPVQRGENE